MPDPTEEETQESVISSRLTELLRKNLIQDHVHGYADKYGVTAEGRNLIATCGVSHFLITRFNIWDEKLRRGAGILEPEAYRAWLTRRIRIFNELLLPTIVGQTFQGFHYLLVLDTERDETLDAFIDHLSPYQMIRPVFIDLRQAHPWAVYEQALALLWQVEGTHRVFADSHAMSKDVGDCDVGCGRMARRSRSMAAAVPG
ncbi:hypothetical protein JCM2811A_19100 [Methylorubrum rhodinum]